MTAVIIMSGTDNEQAQFRATFPPILSAIRMAGDGGMRIMLDVPESDMAEALKLLLWKQQVLMVRVGPERVTDSGRRSRRR